MKILFSLIVVLFAAHLAGQPVNEAIKLQLIQAPVLRVNAGNDLNLSESGSGIIGESLSISGGSPEFSFIWHDESKTEYFDRTPEVNQPGIYWLTVTDKYQCSAVDSLLVYNYGTGVNELRGEAGVLINMDPYKNVSIEIAKLQGRVHISVMSIDGKVIYSFSQENAQGLFSHQIDLSLADQGIYLIALRYNNRKLVQKIILK